MNDHAKRQSKVFGLAFLSARKSKAFLSCNQLVFRENRENTLLINFAVISDPSAPPSFQRTKEAQVMFSAYVAL
jgi:hypothetical protein